MQTGMKLDSKTPECRKFLVKLMDQLESVSPVPIRTYPHRERGGGVGGGGGLLGRLSTYENTLLQFRTVYFPVCIDFSLVAAVGLSKGS